MKKVIGLMIGVLFLLSMSGCDDAYVASQNISKEADNFRIYRRVVFYNGITDEYILKIEGYCSVEFYVDKFVVTVKTEDGRFLKHYLGRADNVFPFVEQLEAKYVSDKRYKVTFKPTAIIPDIEIR